MAGSGRPLGVPWRHRRQAGRRAMARTDAALPGCSRACPAPRASNNRCHSAGPSPPADSRHPWTTPSPSTPRCRWPSPRRFAGRIRRCRCAAKLSAGDRPGRPRRHRLRADDWNAGHGDYKVLYANLSDKDGGAVIAQLSQMNVPYNACRGGSAILVPAAQVHDLRLKLAHRRPAQGLGLRLRADGQRPLRPDPVPGAPHLPARPRGRADALDRLAGRGAERARPPRAAEPERLLSRAAEAERLGAADAAPRPHARPRPDRRHRPPGVVERARAEPEGGERARPERHAADRQRRRRAPGAGLDAQQLQYVQPGRSRLRQAHLRAARADRRPRQPARHRHRRHRLLADRGDLGGVQAEPGRRRQRLDPQPADDRAERRRRRRAAERRAGRGLATSRRSPPPRRSPARRSRCRRAPLGRRHAAAAAGARRSPTTRSTRRCA